MHHQSVAETSPVLVENGPEPGLDDKEGVLDPAHRGGGRCPFADRPDDAGTEAVRPAAFHPYPHDHYAGVL
jgi:hypothetical protein